jgi:predicted O-methyltransferase YrrM
MNENSNKVVSINKKEWVVELFEFMEIKHNEFSNLKILKDVGKYERIAGLFHNLTKVSNTTNMTNITKTSINNSQHTLLCFNVTHGGFLPINSSQYFKKIYGVCNGENHYKNATKNIEKKDISNTSNIFFTDKTDNYKEIIEDITDNITDNNLIIYIEEGPATGEIIDDHNHNHNHDNIWLKTLIDKYKPCIVRDTPTNSDTIFDNDATLEDYKEYKLSNSNIKIHVPLCFDEAFNDVFKYYREENSNIVNYDNLIHLCIMVKNAGPQFENMLQQNMPIIDKFTILDTGSTDETIDIIKRTLVGKKNGELYEEPFINFRDSRNRLLDLAGKSCKYIIMLDDTYVVEGDLRSFLNDTRGDQLSDSYTLYIKSEDTIYGSNRIIKSESGLRYIHTIHEVISDKNNINIVVPKEIVTINDGRFDYMEKRTNERKQLDLKLLFDEVANNPHDPRAYYYLAQTYNCLNDAENTLKYFLKRAEFPNSGFHQEYVDALFEAARTMNFKLNRPWSECEEMYNRCYMADPSRPEALYFIGIHYYLEGGLPNIKIAYEKFKKGYQIGFPLHCQYSLKPTLCYHFLPKFLTKICYDLDDYELGKEVAYFFLQNNKPSDDSYAEILSWYHIFDKILNYTRIVDAAPIKVKDKKIFCFLADGGFNKWAGSSILNIGVGGSETYIIEHARYIQKSGEFNVYVFCNCEDGGEIFEGVVYKPISEYYRFIKENYVHTCIISRFSEYIPVTLKSFTENVYLVIHDLTPSGIVIPIHVKLKKIFCLTEWHVEYFCNIYPQLKDITVPFYYGIDVNKFLIKNTESEGYDTNAGNTNILLDGITVTEISDMNDQEQQQEQEQEQQQKQEQKNKKVPHSFIYSSFPNRGLLELLKMWPKIYEHQPLASLHIYSDVNNVWSNQVEPEKMNNIRQLLQEYGVNTNEADKNGMNIYYHGWVDKKTLAAAWMKADIWFYPCTFMETFCLTALEAAATKTLVITNNLAALQNTVGNRGVIIKGDPMTEEWREKALKKVFKIMDKNNESLKNTFINANYEWAMELSWENRAKLLLDTYILKDNLEHKGMYNWTNDLPHGTREIFIKVIEYFNKNYEKENDDSEINEPIKVLEIGTYTGISLINIVKLIPNSTGYGVDLWNSYNENDLLSKMDDLQIEASFHKNIKMERMEGRVFGIKGDSSKVLMDMVVKNNMYDFIYVDGSHLMLDCYLDLILSWKILNKGGILAIDDYLYNIDKSDKLVSPFEGVNHFLKKYESEYNLLHKEYRVFLQKL